MEETGFVMNSSGSVVSGRELSFNRRVPEELQVEILEFLDNVSLVFASRVCKEWHALYGQTGRGGALLRLDGEKSVKLAPIKKCLQIRSATFVNLKHNMSGFLREIRENFVSLLGGELNSENEIDGESTKARVNNFIIRLAKEHGWGNYFQVDFRLSFADLSHCAAKQINFAKISEGVTFLKLAGCSFQDVNTKKEEIPKHINGINLSHANLEDVVGLRSFLNGVCFLALSGGANVKWHDLEGVNEVRLSHYNFAQNELKQLPKSIEEITFIDCANVTLNDLSESVNTLTLSGCKNVVLNEFPEHIDSLTISNSDIKNFDWNNLPATLERLKLVNCKNINFKNLPEGIRLIKVSGSNLSHVDQKEVPQSVTLLAFSNCSNIDLRGLSQHVTSLVLSDCHFVEHGGLKAAFRNSRPLGIESLALVGYSKVNHLERVPKGLMLITLFGYSAAEVKHLSAHVRSRIRLL